MKHNNRVIVIGASAGGVDALLRIASGLSSEIAAPVLLVLHIGAHRSFLPELLSARGLNRAIFAQTGVVPLPGMIYVAPPDQHLLLEDGQLRLFHGPKEHHARPAINPLFRSAALDQGPGVVGVVLTGMLDDGAAGMYAIQACGGITVVQDPQTAVEPSMPQSAIDAVKVDHIAELDALPELLNRLALSKPDREPPMAPDWLRTEHDITLGRKTMPALASIGAPSGFTCPDCGGALFELGKGRPLRFLCHTGHAFSLRSLASTHQELTDEALWAALRALQEKEAILRRLSVELATGTASSSATSTEADAIGTVIASMRDLITATPEQR